ncbi:MAG: heavy-metal-associated domain-containing protein [Gaiellaceae bacterium]
MSQIELTYSVPGMSCEHCKTAITNEVSAVDGVQTVEVDLATKQVAVRGDGLSDQAVRAAIDEAGYDIAN